MVTRKEIREGIEIILFDNSIKGRKYQKNFTELARDIMRMESEKGAVIQVERELPDSLMEGQIAYDKPTYQEMLRRANYVAVEPVIGGVEG